MANPKSTGKQTQNRYIMHHKRGRTPSRPPASGKAAHLIGYAILAVAMLLIVAGAAVAHEYSAKGVTVTHPWARATPGGATIGSAYLEVKAERGKGDRLIGARSPAAGTVELHNHVMEGGIARMRRVDAIAVPGGTSVVLRPSGYHLMLTNLKAPLKEGDLVKITLVFEKAGAIELEATVEPIGATGPHGFDAQPKTGAPAGAHKH
jgi:periplasmic copper chaperone A